MWSYIFGGSSGGSGRNNSDLPKKAIVELREHIHRLDKKQSYLQTQILNQENETKTFLTKGNKSMAKNSLKKKKIYEAQLVKLEGQRDSLEQQLFSIESANLNLETMRAMKQGAKAMKSMHNGLDIDKVDETMDEVREQVELGGEISDAISKPMYAGINEVDDDELDEELDALAHQDQVKEPKAPVPQPATLETIGKNAIPLPNAPNSKIEPSRAQANQEEEEEEDEDERALRELQAEMGL
ncbi:hypothetical protein BZL39_M03310 [Zygosaccharomyces parabailii]|nr:hypothetical protein BZL39_M03310 [Zygosaccharomyces parabailii]